MKNLNISKDISFPIDFVTQTVAILAKRRSGKSYTMRRIVEELLETEQQVVIVDPKGDQWGIRSSADGKKPGYPVVIFGGEHGDVPLETAGGELVAKLVVEERVSILIDLSLFRKHEVATFMTAFLENLYRLKAQEKYRTAVMLVIDEADAIAPQKPQKGEERMLGAAEDIVRRGGQRGLGCILVTQRSAVLNKNVLTQAEILVVLRTIAPQDLAAMKAWIDVHGTDEQAKELMDSLPALPVGDVWFWSPGWPTAEGIFKRTRALPIRTFDSGATPKPGERKIVPKNLADVDLEALKGQMSEVIEKAKRDDPKELKKRIAELEKEKELEKKHPLSISVEKEVIKRVEVPIITDAQIKKLEKVGLDVSKEAERHGAAMAILLSSFDKIGQALAHEMLSIPAVNKINEQPWRVGQIHKIHTVTSAPMSINRDTRNDELNGPKALSKGARTILTYLSSVYPHWKSKAQIWIAAGYAPSGSFNNMMYELIGAGLIEKDNTVKYASLQRHTLDMLDPSFDASLEKWNNKLSLGARKIFDILKQNPDASYSKEMLAGMTGYAMSGSFNNSIYELTGKELAIKVGTAYQINPEVLDL